jgi:uncharacterized protein (TIGR02145 family)
MKNRSGFFLLMLMVIIGLTFCKKDDPPAILELEELSTSVSAVFPLKKINPVLTYGSVTDIDGNNYKTIQIGRQTWMAENLKTTRYNDGSKIIPGSGGPAGYTDWFGIGEGAYCWFDNDAPTYKEIYGAIYNWYAVGTGKLCPNGWHVPDIPEWNTLVTNLGGEVGMYNERSENAIIHWGGRSEYIFGGSADFVKTAGFPPFPDGCLDGFGFTHPGLWWTTTLITPKWSSIPSAFLVSFDIEGYEPLSYGFSVRCVKD